MQGSTSLYTILFVATLTVGTRGENSEGELEIHHLFKPENCDRKIKVTDMVTLHYKGSLDDGTEFDKSHSSEPFSFQIGIGQVILGWEKGLLGACVGEKLKLIIPPHMGYGNEAHDKIPAKSTLIFEVEILKIEDGPKPANVFKEIDTDKDNRLSRKEVGEFLRKQLEFSHKTGDAGSLEDPDNIQMVDEIFMQEDKDKDDYITHEEFTGPKYDHDEL